MDTLKGAFTRTTGRFRRLGESFVGELEKAHNEFNVHGCSLTVRDINKRSVKVATVFSTFLVWLTLPIIVYYRGIGETQLYFGLVINILVGWILFYLLVLIAHVMWIMSYIIGSHIGKSSPFWGFIEKRWTKSIDKITKDLLEEKSVKISTNAETSTPVSLPASKQQEESPNGKSDADPKLTQEGTAEDKMPTSDTQQTTPELS
ncbi:unnamed protein product [Orchesella dallaii]|uniref:Uncharacterized protein n=1 Tax=Orchesella dallaii TaxID=48710 RepID=A0ABP1Q8D6_9HEXA